ncbi:MAG: beta-lactamase family protein [Actinomycetia bacterium]|nr:beta-lactamase family protein [Actinomycetes bacterium]MCP4963027.1 beta-lactamase family protein [Actinomycetes bacterium]
MAQLHALQDLMVEHREMGLQAGSQLYVSRAGQTLVDLADGELIEGRPIEPHHVLRLYEAGMPLLTVLVAGAVERGRLGLDDLVSQYLPDWGNGKEACTVRHLLTHMGGFAGAELGDRDVEHHEAIEQLCLHRGEHIPGTAAAFHSSPGWRVLQAVLEAAERKPIHRLLSKNILRPTGLNGQLMFNLGSRQIEKLSGQISPVHWCGYTAGGTAFHRETIHNTTWHMAKCDPGISAWGSAAALGRFYEAINARDGRILDSRNTIDLFTSVHRYGLRDRVIGAAVPWGLGFQVAGSFSGSFGHRVFGHDGISGRAFCDPADELVGVYLTNGLTRRSEHERRMSEMTDLIHEAVLERSSSAWMTTGMAAVGI